MLFIMILFLNKNNVTIFNDIFDVETEVTNDIFDVETEVTMSDN